MKVKLRQSPEKLFKGLSRFFRESSEFDSNLTLHIGGPHNFAFSIEDKNMGIDREFNILPFFEGRWRDFVFHPDPAQGNILDPSPNEVWGIKRIYHQVNF